MVRGRKRIAHPLTLIAFRSTRVFIHSNFNVNGALELLKYTKNDLTHD